MRCTVIFAIATLACSAYAQSFAPGHIFITEREEQPCLGDPPPTPHFIREIDPRSGRSWRMTDPWDGLCAPSGLAFTPDGQGLRVVNFASDTVMEFDSAGDGEVIYDRADGISRPTGRNALAYDAWDNLFVINRGTLRILQFPPDGGPATVFADIDDGILTGGGLAFAPNGDLFVALGHLRLLRITPEGQASVFDEFPGNGNGPTSVVFDKSGNMYVAQTGPHDQGKIHRYDGGLFENKRVLVPTGFVNDIALTMAPNERELYAVDTIAVYIVDTETGVRRELFHFPRDPERVWGGFGIAVYIPPGRGDVNCDGSLDLADVEPFIVALLDAEKYKQKYPDCDIKRADITLDGSVDLLDVEPFIALLLS